MYTLYFSVLHSNLRDVDEAQLDVIDVFDYVEYAFRHPLAKEAARRGGWDFDGDCWSSPVVAYKNEMGRFAIIRD